MTAGVQAAEYSLGLPFDLWGVEIEGVDYAVNVDFRDAAVEGLGINIGQRSALKSEGGLGSANGSVGDAVAIRVTSARDDAEDADGSASVIGPCDQPACGWSD